MKHQYFADRRDFLKYELLLDLANVYSLPVRLLSLLMLTPNDDSAEGSVKTYEQGLRRRELFVFLKSCLAAGNRDVSRLRAFMRQVGVDYYPCRDDAYFTDAARSDYFVAGAAAARDHSVIFFDPDIGLETGTRNYMCRNGLEKYLMYADVSIVANAAPRDAVFVVYQHLQKHKGRVRADIKDRCLRLCHAVGSSSTAFVTDRDVAFLVTSRSTRSVTQAVLAHGGRHGLECGEAAVVSARSASDVGHARQARFTRHMGGSRMAATIERSADGSISNALELTVDQVVYQRVDCPFCKDKVFEKWPEGWDAHAAHKCNGVSGATKCERKEEFKRLAHHLFR